MTVGFMSRLTVRRCTRRPRYARIKLSSGNIPTESVSSDFSEKKPPNLSFCQQGVTIIDPNLTDRYLDLLTVKKRKLP